MNDAYAFLVKQFSRLSSLEDTLGILGWDREVMMPTGSAPRRAENLAALEALYHEILCQPHIKEALTHAEPARDDPWQHANLREMNRAYLHQQVFSDNFIEKCVKTTSQCEMLWRKGREKGNFKDMFPVFENVLELTRQKADTLSQREAIDPYDALLDCFETGLRQATIDPLFARLKKELPSLIENAISIQNKAGKQPSLQGEFNTAAQKELGQFVMGKLGFDARFGRLDTSTHPFCGGGRDDIRLTTRYESDSFLPALMGIIHETGHALYDLGLPRKWQAQPVGQAGGMLIHESQSLFMEMQIGRSLPFIQWLMPVLRDFFGGQLKNFDVAQLHRKLTHVQPSFIRVDADEVTYPAHILIRYDLEKALIKGDLKARDLPSAFNEQIKKFLGLTVTNDVQGWSQDIHWPEGLFGYFPCYSLGAFAAAQFMETLETQQPHLEEKISSGDFAPILAWLRQNIHSQGRLMLTSQLIEHVTKKPLGIDAWLRHIKKRYHHC